MITLLDGGMGQELVARTKKATPLWAVQALIDAPDIVGAVHRDYFAAGADVATTNTYNLLPDRLAPYGVEDRLEELTAISLGQAVAARDAHGSGQLAGSLGPLGASYRPDLTPEVEIAAEIYARLARLHAGTVDFHLLETISSIHSAQAGLMGAGVTGLPVWLAVSVNDADGTTLRSGEPLADLLPLLQAKTPAAVLINCATPEAVDQAMPIIARSGLPVGAYANGFTHIAESFRRPGAVVDVLESRTDLPPARYAEFARGWVDLGATIIGGCCEVGPAHIAELRQTFAVAA